MREQSNLLILFGFIVVLVVLLLAPNQSHKRADRTQAEENLSPPEMKEEVADALVESGGTENDGDLARVRRRVALDTAGSASAADSVIRDGQLMLEVQEASQLPNSPDMKGDSQ